MLDARTKFEQAVAEFRAWASSYPHAERSGDWECDYDDWMSIGNAFSGFLDSSDPQRWDQHVIELLLYMLARDNEDEALKRELVGRPSHLLALARAGVRSTERDARWQLADALGSVEADEGEVVPLLEAYAADADEYVSRRTLLALGHRQAPIAEALARRAQAISRCGLRRCRYIGLAKTRLQHVLTAAAINLVRVAEWCAGTPVATTRCSRFSALHAA